ncbi:MAG: class I SAM-dependent methyltransferase [Anaerolineae bacterium]|nr:class I SAM-dependent methyltransferase [Anaerolineae bacterium]
MSEGRKKLVQALWRVYGRTRRPLPWSYKGNLPWDEPDFARRMLREHLDESHAAATRPTAERVQQLNWLWGHLALEPGHRFLDLTCGPGLYAVPLAQRGCQVMGVDFSPAAIPYARQLAEQEQVTDRCTFVEQDIRHWLAARADRSEGLGQDMLFDAAAILYGQLAVFPRDEAARILQQVARLLRPGGRLCLELLNPDRVDKKNSTWWFTDNTGLWGDAPFLHLGERFWDAESRTSTERFHILHLETGEMDEIILCDTTYQPAEMATLLHQAGFVSVQQYLAWDGLPLHDAGEWVVYVGLSS